MDWSAIWSTVREVLTTFAALGGLCIGYVGLQTWRRQARGTAERDLARRVLVNVNRYRESISRCRSRFMSGGEQTGAMRDQGVAPPTDFRERQRAGVAAAYQSRWESVLKHWNEVAVDRIEAKLVWGDHVDTSFSKLEEALRELLWGIDEHLEQMSNTQNRQYTAEAQIEASIRVFEGRAKLLHRPDPVSVPLESGILELSALLGPKLRLDDETPAYLDR